jgi:hypothetical protein
MSYRNESLSTKMCCNCKTRIAMQNTRAFTWGLCEHCLRAYQMGIIDSMGIIDISDIEFDMILRGWK